MEVQVLTATGAGSNVSLSDEIFAREFNETLVHQAVVAYLAGGRAGTKAQKRRTDVSGGGIKPWRQKGTGRARSGTSRSPIWRGGGVTFAARPRDYTQKINKRMYRTAIASILSELKRQNRLVIVDSLTVENEKTKTVLAKLAELKIDDRALLIVNELEINLYLGARNLSRVEVLDVVGINPVSLVHCDTVVMTVDALKSVEEWLL